MNILEYILVGLLTVSYVGFVGHAVLTASDIFLGQLLKPYRKQISIVLAVIVVGLIGYYYPKSSTSTTESFCGGIGDGSCKFQVQLHFDMQQGREVNFIQHLGKGKYSVNLIDLTEEGMARGGSYGVVAKTDSCCNVIGIY